ncbi:hydroxyacid dehydrogenase [Reticulibacter mediterranei]|uniref:Hydroxyacid dehydrogenase n=1 Tax=Reticulibacter mediterranei TaxID=2778369 RepID=A0A8J3N1B6_9CHLR|nr:D-2-hydroxyacid dehydrogenase [Reticulibacter mediterranei]GHO92423.1 hydroxyacid dehydrogenase [Reticulibacter mediterranei]
MAEGLKVLSTFPFSLNSQMALRQAAQADVVCVTSSDELRDRLRETEILCSERIPDDWRGLAPHLRWLQVAGAGVDNLQPTGILSPESGVVITTAIGINASTIGEYVIGSMLMFNRTWPEMVRLQERHIWPLSANWYKLGGRELGEQTIGIIGLGHIGRRVAQLAAAFGMRVLATRHSTRSGDTAPDVDRLYPLSQLHELLHQCDYVVLAVPLTPETELLIGEAELRAMQPHTYLVNIARGRIIDEQALIRALREGWIGGAGLDVAAEEPLPADSPLYSMPNVILTPHISGVSVHYEQRLATLFADNLQRYRSGQALRNLYNPARGY